jgi:hypothetical protein
MTSDILIVFAGLIQKTIVNVSGYGVNFEGRYFWFDKNGHKGFIPIEGVMFFGRKFDYMEETKS